MTLHVPPPETALEPDPLLSARDVARFYGERIGCTEVSFDLWPGHPREQEVRAILADTRRRLAALWEAVEEENRDRSLEISYKITFYYGQFRTDEEQDQ